ncbi:murein biosynthesis integral membrane protein MurJ [Pikeienuella sp. HZG-20]|uniref:murein biosynthesis integral membrane protein MurJ n=1 Tax=Paludibacillus litoralis TaxID=3133267 RepID=UPI0030EB8D2C
MSADLARPIRLLRAFATVGSWTMASRVLGFIRDVMIAGLLGAGPVAEAFFVAFRLPNMFRRFFAEGAFNMAFIPLFSKKLESGEDAKAFAEDAMAGLIAILLLLTLAALLLMPALIFALAAGFADDPERFRLAVLYGRIQFPYLLCMALTALFSGVLNALGRFAAPAATPLLLNIILIGAMAVAALAAAPVGSALALGVLAAGFAQVWLVARAARLSGFELKLRRPRWSPEMSRLVALGVPGALAGGVMQINLLIGTAIASFFSGAVAWLSYADRLYQLPLGVVGVAIGVVLLPELSRRVRAADEAGARAAFCRATEFSMALTLPAAAALVVAAGPFASVLFSRGAFSGEDAAAVAAAVALFAFGLPAFVMQKVVQPAYFAREDTKSPLRFAAASVALNTAISLLGAPLIGWLAIPIGTTLAGWLNLALLWRGARGFGDAVRPDARLRRRLPRLVLASALMAGGLHLAIGALADALIAPGVRYFALAGVVLLGGALYAILAFALGALAMADLKTALRR